MKYVRFVFVLVLFISALLHAFTAAVWLVGGRPAPRHVYGDAATSCAIAWLAVRSVYGRAEDEDDE